MQDNTLGYRVVVAPFGALPNQPAVVFGPVDAIPPEVIAFYAPASVVGGVVMRRDSATYTYDVLVIPSIGLPYRATGGIEPVGLTITEAYRVEIRSGFGSDPTVFDIRGGFAVDGIFAPRGYRMAVSAAPLITSGNALTTPAAASAVFTAWTSGVNSMTWQTHQVYEVKVIIQSSNNLPGAATTYNWCRYQLNVVSVHSGLTIGATVNTIVQNGHLDDNEVFVFYVANNTAADIVSGLGVSIAKGQSSVGATVSLESCTISVMDAGSVTGVLDAIAASMS